MTIVGMKSPIGNIGGGNTIDGPKFAVNQTEEIVNSNSLVNVTDMKFPVEANKNYAFRIYHIGSSTTTADVKIKHIGPSGSTIDWNETTIATTVKTANNTVSMPCNGTSTKNYMHVVGRINVGANAGDFQVQYAQQTNEPATDTKYMINAYIVYWELS